MMTIHTIRTIITGKEPKAIPPASLRKSSDSFETITFSGFDSVPNVLCEGPILTNSEKADNERKAEL